MAGRNVIVIVREAYELDKLSPYDISRQLNVDMKSIIKLLISHSVEYVTDFFK